ncbi:MAG: hypothetical protein RBT06_04660 [Smithellaceae bacterium]|jgi:hypothetical protein|nr:hypothetical protein [Smithellaceae bacterium]
MKKTLFVILMFMITFNFSCPIMVRAETQYSPETTPTEASTEPSVGIKVVDILLVRPPCAVGSIISTAVYLAICIPAFIIGVDEPAAQYLVEAPWRFTSYRYIGEFNHYKDEQPIMGVWEF